LSITERRQFGDDVVARLAADQDAAHGARLADARRRRAALQLGWRGIRQIGRVALAGVDDEEAGCARSGQQGAGGRHRGGEQRDVVAQALAEAAGFEEVALHVDDDEGRPGRIERQGGGFGVEKGLRGGHWLPRSDRAGPEAGARPGHRDDGARLPKNRARSSLPMHEVSSGWRRPVQSTLARRRLRPFARTAVRANGFHSAALPASRP